MKQKLINWVLSSVVRVVTPQNVIRDIGGVLYLGKNKVTKEELTSLKAEANALDSMRLWLIINESIKQTAYERGWRDSKTMDEVNAGKIQYNVLSTQQSIINTIKDKNI